ncbi:MAG: peptidylprolyl isomerase [gamma proteobacterium symbiont of Bathyaustriella thionipta]|nr:peptidylprolyl isomerase [gamma proteobacterium symbiont of Bathyaustriella thionipta]
MLENKPAEEKVQQRYQELIAKMPKSEFKARHILLEKEDEAKAVIAELDTGADFAELAKQKSTGPSASSGGDLGWFSAGRMVKPFSDATAKLEKGTYTKEPVKTQFGWHVILLEDQRETAPPPLKEVRAQIVQGMQKEILASYIDDLRKNANIEVLTDKKEEGTPINSTATDQQTDSPAARPASEASAAAPAQPAAAPAQPAAEAASDTKTDGAETPLKADAS